MIECHLSDVEGELMPPLAAIRATPDSIIATYDDGTVVEEKLRCDDGDLMLVFNRDDSPCARRSRMAIGTPADEIVAAFEAWMTVDEDLLDDEGTPRQVIGIDDGHLVLRDEEDEDHMLPLDREGRALGAVWIGDALLGFGYGAGVPVDGTSLETLRARAAIQRSRVLRSWHVAKGAGLRQDAPAATTDSVRMGSVEKLGLQSDHPLPGDYTAEITWVQITQIDGTALTGRLLNDGDVTGARRGEMVAFDIGDILGS